MTLGLDKVTWNVRVQKEKQDSDCTQEEGTSRALPQTLQKDRGGESLRGTRSLLSF